MNWTIPVYAQERELGLAEIIEAKHTIAYASPVNNADAIKSVLRRPSLKKVDEVNLALATNLDQADLYYFASILVSSNWNMNDDVFGLKELWLARKTPEDKPINIEHQHDQIVGHITNVLAVDASNFSIIPDDTPLDQLPKSLHLLTGGVLYKFWKTQELQDRINEVFDKIEAKEEFVSMEVLFRDFDYAIRKSDGDTGIIARNEETSFLTKHLRCYGGTGEYNGTKIGRYPKQLIFSGKGLTTNPANSDENGPISVIFNTETFEELFVEQSAGAIMSKELEAQVKDLNDKVAKLEADHKVVLEAKDAKIGELEAAVKGANELVEKANASKDELTKNLDEVTKKYDEISAKYVASERTSKLVDAGHSKENAEAFVAKFASLNDEMFSEVAKHYKADKQAVDSDDEDKEDAEASLEKVEDKTEVDLVEAESDKVKTTTQAIARFFGNHEEE